MKPGGFYEIFPKLGALSENPAENDQNISASTFRLPASCRSTLSPSRFWMKGMGTRKLQKAESSRRIRSGKENLEVQDNQKDNQKMIMTVVRTYT